MRALLALILIAAASWSVFWWVGARGTDRDLAAWLDTRHDAGWIANFDAIQTRGFPNRYDTTITDLELADPGSGIAWAAPFFQIFRLSYQPRHAIAVWSNEQTIAAPGDRVAVTATDARGSFVFGAGASWPLDRAVLTASDLGLVSDAGWTASLGSVRLASRPSERIDGALDLGLDIRNFRPASARLAQLEELGVLPATLEQVQIDAAVTFDAVWDRDAIEVARPQIESIDLNLAQVSWGEMDLRAAGALELDTLGRPTGSITLKLKNWREMLELAKATGWLPERLSGPIEGALDLLAGLAGSAKTLDVPLNFRAGRVSFGPIPLGSVAPLQLR